MTLRNLQVFVTVAECCNMTKAAEKLYVSQPSVSMVISDIEREYDVALFERMCGKLILTQTGHRLLEYAKQILKTEHLMENFLRDEATNFCIRIGVTVTVGSSIFSSIIAEMKTTMPNINYHVTVANTDIIEKMLMNGEIDIALVEGILNNSNLEVRTVIRDRLVLICSQDHPFHLKECLNIKELAGLPLILREEQSGTRKYFEDVMQLHNIDCTVRWSSYSYGAIIDAVEHNLGLGIISNLLARKYVSNGKIHICNIIDANLDRDIKLVYKKNKYITDILLKFSEICGNTKYFNVEADKLLYK